MSEQHENGLNSTSVVEADAAAPPAGMARTAGTFHSFRYRDYTLFWIGSLLSNTGSWMQNYALAIVVYSFRRSEFDLGLVHFLSGIPVLLLSLLAGAVADRFDKRNLLIWAQGILLVQAAALGVLHVTGRLSADDPIASLAWVAGLGLIGGVMNAMTFPTWQSLLPDLVPRPALLNAIALNSAQFQGSRLAGPLIAGALVLAGASMGDVFFVNAASFLFVIAALAAIRPLVHDDYERQADRSAPEGSTRGQRALDNITAGMRYARDNRVAGMLLLSTAVMTIFGMPYMMLLPAIADKALGADKLGVSYLMAANGFGAIFGALLVAGMSQHRDRNRMIPLALLLMGGLLVGFGLSRSFALSMVISVLAGAAVLTTNSLANTSIQSMVPHHLRGRVMALFVMAFVGLMPVSSIIFGSIGEAIGPGNAILGGALVVIAWALYLMFTRSLEHRDGE